MKARARHRVRINNTWDWIGYQSREEREAWWADQMARAEKFSETPHPCSLQCCGNPRRWFGELTMQEKRMNGAHALDLDGTETVKSCRSCADWKQLTNYTGECQSLTGITCGDETDGCFCCRDWRGGE